MAPAASSRKRLFLYPAPIRAPDGPPRVQKKPNPRIYGYFVVVAAFLMEWVGFIATNAWYNAGFASLRGLNDMLMLTEPRYDAGVFPLDEEHEDEGEGEQDDDAEGALSEPEKHPYAVADLRKRYLSGEVTPLQVVQSILPLIRRDISPPGAHSLAWLEVNVVRILQAAEASTRRYKEGESLGLLDGIPTAVKDEYDMKGYKTTLGSVNDYVPLTEAQSAESKGGDGNMDSWCVRLIQDTGAIILGKLSMHEFGLDTSGVNPIHGTPRNPFNAGYYCGGSSGGSAYAVAAGLLPFAMGSDGGGSVRVPASFCSAFGLKPTHGRVSFFPMHNHSNSAGVNGPLAVDMRTLATIYDVVKVPGPNSPFPPVKQKSLRARTNRLTGKVNGPKTLGIPETWIQQSTPAIQKLCRDMIDWLVVNKGYETMPIDIPFLAEGQIAHAITLLTDGATLLPSIKGITAANKILIALGRITQSRDYQLAQRLRNVLMQHLSWLWSQHPNMLIITPTTACAGWPIRDEMELRFGISDGDQTMKSMEYVWMANLCGVPSITVPAGFVKPEGVPGEGEIADDPHTAGRVPVGLMAMAEWCDEEACLSFGFDAEEAGWALGRRGKASVAVDIVQNAKNYQNGPYKDASDTEE